MFTIGCHLSSSKGYLNMAETAVSINANTFQFFTRNPRGGAAKPIDENDIKAFLEYSISNNKYLELFSIYFISHKPLKIKIADDITKIKTCFNMI